MPRSFKRCVLPVALLGAMGALSNVASAVYLSPDGQGQALIYPYYTVQSAGGNAFNTYLSVVNTTARAKAVKVRFREGKNGREVLGFNLFLAANDVWTAAVGPADASAGSPAILATADKSCTAPPIPAGGVEFRNFVYTGTFADGGPTTLDRTREGYFEVIEMANLTGTAATAVSHTSNGVPADCGFVQGSTGLAANPSAYLTAPSGGLSGTYVLINVANGLSFSGNATALGQFSATTIYSGIGEAAPDLGSANPPFATTQFQMNLAVSSSGPSLLMGGATYANGRDAVSAALMKAGLVNEYVLDSATRSATDWVLTFPTKALHVVPGSGAATAPFMNNFGSTGSCEPMAFVFFNREEASATLPSSYFPEAPPQPPGLGLCWSASVVSFGGTVDLATGTPSSVLGSTNAITKAVNGFQNGWAGVYFVGTGASSGLSSVANLGQVLNLASGASANPATLNHKGLPVIGFMARTLNNGLLNCTTFGGAAGTCVGSYGALLDHRYSMTTTPTP